MTRAYALALATALAVATGGCGMGAIAFMNRPTEVAPLHADTSLNEAVNTGEIRSFAKKGEACAYSVAGLSTYGDASVSRAMEEADLRKIVLVENRSLSLLGLYSRYCTIVYGE